jgi:predicted RNase H-like HicB family nuclease
VNKKQSQLWDKAQRLALQNYTVSISEDTLSNGEKVYVLEHPELDGCIAHGSTLDEALDELRQATISYLYYLLVDGLDVPSPLSTQTITATNSSFTKGKGDRQSAVQITLGNWKPSEKLRELFDDTSQSEGENELMRIAIIE